MLVNVCAVGELLYSSLAMMSFVAIARPLQDAAVSQDGRNFSSFKALYEYQKPFAEVLQMI